MGGLGFWFGGGGRVVDGWVGGGNVNETINNVDRHEIELEESR